MAYRQTYISPLPEMAAFQELQEALQKKKGPVCAGGCIDSQKVDLMQELGKQYRYSVVVTYSDLRAKEIYEDYRLFCSDVFLFPGKDVIFFQSNLQGRQLLQQRIRVLRQLHENAGGVIITTMRAMMNVMAPFATFAQAVLDLEVGQEVDIKNFCTQLVSMGYERCTQVEEAGQFAIRGGIIDIYPLTEDVPVRIELWGDEIDSIRSFDPDSQRSVKQCEKLRLYPASEYILSETDLKRGNEAIAKDLKKQTESLKKQGLVEEANRLQREVSDFLECLEYSQATTSVEAYSPYYLQERIRFADCFSQEESIFFLDEPNYLREAATGIEEEFAESMKNRLEKGYLLPKQTLILYDKKTTEAALCRKNTVFISTLDGNGFGNAKHLYSFQVQGIHAYKNGHELLLKDLHRYHREKFRVVLLCASRTRAQRLANELMQEELLAYYKETPERQVALGEIMVTTGNLHSGFVYPQVQFALITESDLFGEHKVRSRAKTAYKGKRISDLSQLKSGDYVVHERYGLGIYRGIEQQSDNGVVRDYIKISYAEGGELYVLMQNLNQIMKYAAGSDVSETAVKLNKIGSGSEWRKAKDKVKTHVREMAAELVRLYSARQNGSGFAFSKDSVWQQEFEEMFPYEETEDQLEAIEQTKKDMESTKIMDRLVCGDVGYGKTEIAIRAAFKAVQDGKQVAYLVPTTILAQQHYNTFKQRMKDYPIRVEQLSRFCTPAQTKETLQGLQNGMVDIVIGTHRLLSKDVHFKDLGLLVIDEEQRFGVTHKEKIKQMKNQVDVLTLTATPIPRTLHMSMIGVRDMSVLEQAPRERIPIQTYVMEYQDELVREAICRELSRNGQVYYVFNRVKDIVDFTAGVQKLVPEAVVAFAHGQMSERELERIMIDFINGDIQVLVSTTIIETGLDISNVNTIIIHDADRFGLSQLYQLRGRVGRSNKMAYAFILYRRDRILKEEAQKRLQAIREFTELGSGVKIALRDLEIRGAGNLLGAEQHGHICAVGYDLYCKMLNEAVDALQGKTQDVPSFETTINLLMNAYIPGEYIHNESMRLDIYKKISTICNEEDYSDMQDELVDRFGDIPQPVEELLQIALLKAAAHEARIEEISANRREVHAKLEPNAKIDGMKATEVLSEYRKKMKYVADKSPYFCWIEDPKTKMDAKQTIEATKSLIHAIKRLLVSEN